MVSQHDHSLLRTHLSLVDPRPSLPSNAPSVQLWMCRLRMLDTERLDGTYLSTQALHGGLGQQKGHRGSITGRPHHVLGSPQSHSVEHLKGGGNPPGVLNPRREGRTAPSSIGHVHVAGVGSDPRHSCSRDIFPERQGQTTGRTLAPIFASCASHGPEPSGRRALSCICLFLFCVVDSKQTNWAIVVSSTATSVLPSSIRRPRRKARESLIQIDRF